MPLLRYFVFVGGALLTLLFAVNLSLPPLNAEPERANADRTTIRIHSQQRWPSAVVMDTAQPIIVPPPAVAEAPIAKPAREAFALATDAPVVKPGGAAKPARQHTRHNRVARAPAGPAPYEPFGFRSTWASGW